MLKLSKFLFDYSSLRNTRDCDLCHPIHDAFNTLVYDGMIRIVMPCLIDSRNQFSVNEVPKTHGNLFTKQPPTSKKDKLNHKNKA